MPRLSNSVRIAGFILLALLVYFVFRGITRPTPETASIASAAPTESTSTRPDVTTRMLQPVSHTVYADLKGRTEPDRAVTLRSETIGTVSSARIAEGQYVEAGTVLCGLDVESRAARLAEAEAAYESSRLDYESATKLEAQGWTTSNRAAAAKATLDRSEAALAAARIELNKTKLRAPFSGVFEKRLAEVGDFLSAGAACGELVDLDPIIIAVDVTESQVSKIMAEAPAKITLANGQSLDGQVRYVARRADPQTRTFRVEVEAPNPDNAVPAGLTASLRIALGTAPAYLLSPASLVLNDDGGIGVRYVDQDDVIQFAAIAIIDDAAEGVWVTGIPDQARLLSVGQDYLSEGISVNVTETGGL